MRIKAVATLGLLLPTVSCASILSRSGARGTVECAVYPGIVNIVSWFDASDDVSWIALLIDGPLCLALDTLLLPIDILETLREDGEGTTSAPDAIDSPANTPKQPTGAPGGAGG